MELINFFFGNFWHFLGLLIMICLIGEVLLKLVAIICGWRSKDFSENTSQDNEESWEGHIDMIDSDKKSY